MNELLFKLKKDGQCEGDLRWNGKWMYRYPIEGASWLIVRLESNLVIDDETDIELCRFDSIHPFVCRDRHGHDCFEGDAVRWEAISPEPKTITGILKWQPEECIYLVVGEETTSFTPREIELIDAEQQAQASSDAEQGKG